MAFGTASDKRFKTSDVHCQSLLRGYCIATLVAVSIFGECTTSTGAEAGALTPNMAECWSGVTWDELGIVHRDLTAWQSR